MGEKYVYILDVDKREIDSVKLSHNRYENLKSRKRVYYEQLNNQEVLVFDYGEMIDVYSTDPFKLLYSFKKDYEERGSGSKPLINQNTIIYLNKKNELICREITTNRIIWKYSTGGEGISFLGITVGSVADYISEYILVDENPRSIFINTSAGDLIKINGETGKEILKHDRFRGNKNLSKSYDGKLTFIAQADMNEDGFPDFPSVSTDKNIYCINGKDLTTIWYYKTDSKFEDLISLYDINGDSIPEVFAINIDQSLFIIDGKNGQAMVNKKLSDNGFGSRTILCDYNNDGVLDLVVMLSTSQLTIYELNDVKVSKGMIVINK
jgi:outer membrane protein assembly factor BamB